MGKSTINGQFSIAMLNYQRVTLVNGRMIILRDFGEGASLEMGGSISRIWIFQVAGVGR
jgi:hypothetical protein